jgi:hypothetical protein
MHNASDSFKLVKIDFNKAVFLNSKNNSELLRGVIEFRLVSNVIKSNAFLKVIHILFGFRQRGPASNVLLKTNQQHTVLC